MAQLFDTPPEHLNAPPPSVGRTHCVLLVDDDPRLLEGLQRALRREPYTVLTACDTREADRQIHDQPVDLIVCDEMMPGLPGSAYLTTLRERHPDMIRVLLTGQATVDVAVRAINDGEVYRFFVKPCNPAELIAGIRQGLRYKDLVEGTRRLLDAVREQGSLLDQLEHDTPGISVVDRDETGAIVVDESSVDLDVLLQEVATELERADLRLRRQPSADAP